MKSVYSLCAVYPDGQEKIFGGYFFDLEDANKHMEFLVKDQTTLYEETRDPLGNSCTWKISAHLEPENS